MDSLIFDLDGTLWDSREAVVLAWNEVIKSYKEVTKKVTIEDFKQTMGLQAQEIGSKLFPELEDSRRKQLLDECGKMECTVIEKQGGTLYKNVEEGLRELSTTYKLFIVSNCQAGYIESFFKYHKLGSYFQDYENPGRTGLSKGENIQLVIERNKLSSSIYVGDTAGDQKAATYAEIPFIYARYGFGNVSDFDYSIDRFDDLLDLVKTL